MPQRDDTVNPSMFESLGGALFGGGPNSKAAFEREKIDRQAERDRQKQDLEERKFKLQSQDSAAQQQQHMLDLQLKQQSEQRAQAAAALAQAGEQRAVMDQDIQDWQVSNPQEKPIEPQAPNKPDYSTLGTDPMVNYDEPTELENLNTSLMLEVGRRARVPGADGAEPTPYKMQTDPETGKAIIPSVPGDAIGQIRSRFIQYVQAGVTPAEAEARATGDILGAHPLYQAPKPAVKGWFTDDPAQPASVQPDTATVPQNQTAPDSSQGYKARQKAIDDEYQAKLKVWEAAHKAYTEWKPAPYPGFPWRQRLATGGGVVPPQPAPGVPSVPGSKPQPQPNVVPQAAQPLPKRVTTKGGNVLEFD